MCKKILIAVSALCFSFPSFAQERSLYGNASIEDGRSNTYYGIEKFIMTFPTTTNTDLTASCGGINKFYGGNSSNPFNKKAELIDYQQYCTNQGKPTQLIQIKWRIVGAEGWFIKNFILTPPGSYPQACNISITLLDSPNLQWPDNFSMTYTGGCGTP